MILDFEGKLEQGALSVESKIVREVEEEVQKVERVIDTKLWKVRGWEWWHYGCSVCLLALWLALALT